MKETLRQQLIRKGQFLQLNHPDLLIFSKDSNNPYYIDSLINSDYSVLDRNTIELLDLDTRNDSWTFILKMDPDLDQDDQEVLIDRFLELIDDDGVYIHYKHELNYLIVRLDY